MSCKWFWILLLSRHIRAMCIVKVLLSIQHFDTPTRCRCHDYRHKAILDYLSTNGFTESFQTFRNESGNQAFTPGPKQNSSGLLEKKWTSVIRLQKKVMIIMRLYCCARGRKACAWCACLYLFLLASFHNCVCPCATYGD